MANKYIVDLNKDEKAEMVALTQKGRPGARKIKRATILLLVNSGKPDFEITELFHTSWLTVLRTRHRFIEGGLDFALDELPRAGGLSKIDDKSERNDAQATIAWRFTIPNAREKLMKLYPVREEQ